MKKKVLAALCAGFLGTAVIATGTTGVFAAETETADESKIIGENKEGAFCVMLANLTGKDIKAVKISEDTKYDEKENLLQEDDVFAAEEERMLCYLPEVKEEDETEKEKAEEEKTVPAYNIQFTFADDTTAEIHTFPFGDVDTGEVHLEEEIAYLIFESVSLKEEINTLESETKIADELKAAKEAAETAAGSSSSGSSSSGDYYEDYSDYDYSDAGTGGSDAGSADGGDACLGGGLLF